MAGSGRLFAICCAADLTSEIKDIFLQENEDFFHGDLPGGVVFVDSFDRVYTEAAVKGNNEPSSPDSPFKGISPQKSFRQLWKRVRANGSDVDCLQFAIMDERSLEDKTVLVVQEPDEVGGEVSTVRVEFRETVSCLIMYMVHESNADEDQAIAEAAEDGVFRSGLNLRPMARRQEG